MMVPRRSFWFHDGVTCRQHCTENDTQAEHWKSLDEAQTFRFVEPANAVQKSNKTDHNNVFHAGETEDGTLWNAECHDDTCLEPLNTLAKMKAQFKEILSEEQFEKFEKNHKQNEKMRRRHRMQQGRG